MRTLLVLSFTLNLACVICALSASTLTQRVLQKQPVKLDETAGARTDTRSLADDLKFYVYTRHNAEKPQQVEASVESVIRNIYKPWLPTAVSIPRIGAKYDSSEHKAIVATKLEEQDCNVIAVDWSSYADDDRIPGNGAVIAEFLLLLHEHFDVILERIHVVGFAEGAHVAGAVGRNIYAATGTKFLHITGLDPVDGAHERLTSSDAQFVDVIHTNVGGYGLQAPCGHADYYPNGGAVQPNCSAEDQRCSHERAYELAKEMWSQQNEFVSAKCASPEHLGIDVCVWLNVKMGENLEQAGVYYLETNGRFPYSKGSFVFAFM